MSELPLNWKIARIGDLTVDCAQRIPSDKEQFQYIDITAIDREKKSISSPQLLLGKDAPSRARKHVFAGDVLVSMTRPNLNAVALVPDSLNGQIASTGFDVLRVPELDSRWLYYLVRTPSFVGRMSELVQGALYPAVRSKDVRSFEVPVAPLNEQNRIADKLDSILARVNASRERLDRVPAILKRFRQSVLAAATSGKLTEEWRAANPVELKAEALVRAARQRHVEYLSETRGRKSEGKRPKASSHGNANTNRDLFIDVEEEGISEIPDSWAWGRASELVEPGAEIVYGIVQPGAKLASGVPYVRGMDIENGEILVGQLLKTSPAIAERYARSALKGGDVLLGIIRATKVAIVPDELLGANITQGTARFRPSRVIRTKYLAAVLQAPKTQAWLHSHYRGIDMPGLNLADVRRVPIPLPPLSEQDEIVNRMESLLSCADRLETRYIDGRALVERLTPALLAKAFRGELVPQDPKDEPASLLLERIRAARETTPTKSKKVEIGGEAKMTKVTTQSVKDLIRELPDDHFTFEDLRTRVSTDYETLKEVVFDLLSEAQPKVKQVFDTKAKSMGFVRVNP